MNLKVNEEVTIIQSVAILIDGNNMERSIHEETNDQYSMLNFDALIPELLGNRGLNRLIYFQRRHKHIFKTDRKITSELSWFS